ncbi:DUF3902 family protein, partial [Bacillus cereus]|nr:DUF3902 family protein [Bacillus cereus]
CLFLMVWYCLFVLLLFVKTLILLVFVLFVYRKNYNIPGRYRILILFNLFLTLAPVLWPLLLTLIGNGMNASAGW